MQLPEENGEKEIKREATQAPQNWEWAVTCGLHSHLIIGVLGQSPSNPYYGPVDLSREMRERSEFWPKTPCKSNREVYLSRKCLTHCLPAEEPKSFTRAKEQGGGREGDEEVAGVGLAQESEEGSRSQGLTADDLDSTRLT